MHKALLLSVLWLLMLSACRPVSHYAATVTVQRRVMDTSPLYSGRIQALRTLDIIAPYDGTLEQLPVHVGQAVAAGNWLLTLRSDQYAKASQQAVLNFLKAKDDYHNQVQKYRGAQQLWQHGLISANDYHSQQSELATSYALLLQQQNQLKPYLSTPIAPTWNLADRSHIATLFAEPQDTFKMYAPISGLVLSPSQTAHHSGNPTGLLATVGSAIKQGDSLLSLADVSGYRVTIRVSQLQINALFIGQPATISGEAFREQLSGRISQIGLQARTDPNANDDSAPTYVVDIQITALPPLAQRHIRLGMSARVALLTPTVATLSIPLSAVGFSHNQPVVMQLIQHQPRMMLISTGQTSVDRVQVLAGLNEGDQILATYPS